MASSKIISFALLASVLYLISVTSFGQLTHDFYSRSCPRVFEAVGSVVRSAVSREKRMGASLVRLHFHDCFVNGCDGSVLLDNTPSFTGEKTAGPNANSARGFNVIDDVKSEVEEVCPGVVSCADVLAITALESVAAVSETTLLGGPRWNIKLGRRDSRTASLSAANSGVIPPPSSTLNNLINRFQAQGLSVKDLVALSGAHTIGQARCTTFRARVHNDTNIDTSFARSLQSNCPLPTGLGDNNIAPLDVETPVCFDNSYFTNLINEKGLLSSDQLLYSGGVTDFFVEQYSENPERFHEDFAAAMITMGDISPLTGSDGEIRENCRVVNS